MYLDYLAIKICNYNNKCVGFFPGHASLAYFFFLGSWSEKNVAMAGACCGGLWGCSAGFATGGAG